MVRLRRARGSVAHLLAAPEDVQRVLVSNSRGYRKSHHYRLFSALVGDGLITSEGERWIAQRRDTQSFFLGDRITQLGRVMGSEIDRMLRRWETVARAGEVVDLRLELRALALLIAAQGLFSTDLSARATAIGEALDRGLNARLPRALLALGLRPSLATASRPSFRRAAKALHAVSRDLIRQRMLTQKPPGDLLDAMLASRRERSVTPTDDEDLVEEVTTLLVTGHETTAGALCAALMLIARHPREGAAVWSELDRVLAGRAPTVDDLSELPASARWLLETLRLYPPVWSIVREAIDEDEVQGFQIPAGSTVFCSPFVTQRHPALWDRPDTFDPERFSPERAATLPRLAFFPFGAGPRQCLGSGMATQEGQLVLASIWQRFQVEPLAESRLNWRARFTLRPSGPLLARLTPRR